MRRLILICGCGLLFVASLRFFYALAPKHDHASKLAVKQVTQKLADALTSKNQPAVRELAAEAAALRGDSAGIPEVADQYQQAPQDVAPLTRAEAQARFDTILQFVQKNKWWRMGLDPTKTEHMPREVASCMVGCLAGCRADSPNHDALLKEAVEAGDYLLWAQKQTGTGVIPLPAFHGGGSRAHEAVDHFLKAAEREGKLDEAVKNGWIIDDLTDGGLQYDNGVCGVALFELFEASMEARFRDGALAAADWAIERPCVTNWNYNSFSVYLLATAYGVTHDPKYLDAAREKARLGVLPGQLHDGPRKGRWADPHNARPAYHYIMVRGLCALFAVLPDKDPDSEQIAGAINSAMLARNDEFSSKGIMNVESALEALLLFKSLPARQQQAIGPCNADEALGVLERYCTARLRKGQNPFSPGVGGRYFESVLTRAR